MEITEIAVADLTYYLSSFDRREFKTSSLPYRIHHRPIIAVILPHRNFGQQELELIFYN